MLPVRIVSSLNPVNWRTALRTFALACLPNDPELVADLGNVEDGYDATNAILLEAGITG